MAQEDYATEAEFRTRFPEFVNIPVDDPLILATIEDAKNYVDPAQFGASTNQAHSLIIAHLLVKSPRGQTGRRNKESVSVYWSRYQEILRQGIIGVTVGGGVSG